MSSARTFNLALLINPLAGVGGSVALKGSDGDDIAQKALSLGAKPMAQARTHQALAQLQGLDVKIITYPGNMGELVAKSLGFEVQVLGQTQEPTSALDTQQAVLDFVEYGVDLLLFSGGDGTARNIADVAPEHLTVLGVPAGVKIHSGVYAITPKAAGQLLSELINGKMLTLERAQVRDIDEEAVRAGRIRAKYYAELQVPVSHRYIQNVKSSGLEVESLVVDDIAAYVVEEMQEDVYYIIGSGTTVQGVMQELALENTLLGVDLVKNNQLVASDCTAQQLLELTDNAACKIIISVIGGQGHIIGRGNQQLSTQLLERVGKANIWLLATKTKLQALEGRPLICDSHSPSLNEHFSGAIEVITGYRDKVLYLVA